MVNSTTIMSGRKVLVAALLASAGATLPQVALAQASDTTSASSTEIIVTAQRREERAQDVPITITAFSSDGLRERGVTSLQSLQSQVPSLVIAPNGQASRDVMSPSIRGQSASFQGSPGVVVYMNEVPLPSGITLSNQGGPGMFVDLQNVQVLSGAQGTLFGRNTTGGAILLTTAKPTDKLEGHIQGGFGNYNMTELEAVLNVPLSDKARVRLVGASRDRDGFTQDVNWNKDRDDQHWRMARASLWLNPVEGVENSTMAYYGHSRTNGTGTVAKGFNTNYYNALATRNVPLFASAPTLTMPVGTLKPSYNFCGASPNGAAAQSLPSYGSLFYALTHAPANYSAAVANGILAPTPLGAFTPCTGAGSYGDLITKQNAMGNRKVAHGVDDYAKVESWGINNTTDVDLTSNLKVRNILSYAELKSYYSNDMDGTVAPIYDTGLTGFSETSPRDWYKLFTEELQFQGSALNDKLTYTVGGFYMKQSPAGEMKSYAINVCAYSDPMNCSIGMNNLSVENQSKALYAQATLDFGAFSPALDRLRLTGGYRYTWDHISGSNTSWNSLLAADGTPIGTPGCGWTNATVTQATVNTVCNFKGNLKSKSPNWTIGLDYRPIDNLLVYGKVTRGYKAGGFNGYAVFENTRTFGPEFVTDYEGGFKSDFNVGGMRGRFNVNGFWMDYKNIQRAAGDTNAATNTTGAITLSSAKAEIKGVEIEAMIQPIEQLEIGGNYSYTHAKYKSFLYNSSSPVADCSSDSPTDIVAKNAQGLYPVDMTCRPLQYLSPNIYSVYGRLQVPTAESFGQVSLFVSYSWTDKQDTSPLFVETFPNGAAMEPGVKLPSFGLLNATLDWKNALGSPVDLSIFGTNITNKEYRISNTGTFQTQGGQGVTYGEPRMYGVRLRYSFGK